MKSPRARRDAPLQDIEIDPDQRRILPALERGGPDPKRSAGACAVLRRQARAKN